MRSEKEMFDIILNFAGNDERVFGVYMNGSRANPCITRDSYQDYDIVYVVEETGSFLADRRWISVFGEIAMVQEPDSNDLGWGNQADYSRSYCWLILFRDGTRIDLRIQTVEVMRETLGTDSLTKILLDKRGIFPEIPPSNDSSYWIQKPDSRQYAGCCNEFWWCLNNVAKGIVRDQLPYAFHMYYETVHKELDRMLEWYIGARHQFRITSGMWGKYFKKYLPEAYYSAYEKTYSDAGYENMWRSIFCACDLFRTVALEVGEAMGWDYAREDDENMTAYLEKMCQR